MSSRPGRSKAGGSALLKALEQNVLIVLVLAAGATIEAIIAKGAVAPDSWYSLVGGRLIVRHGLPHHDTLAILTHGREWIDQQWLAQLGIYALWVVGGWGLGLLAVVATYTGAFAVTAGSARHGGASEAYVALVTLACFLTGLGNTVLRAQIAGYLLFALVIALVLADERRPARRTFLVFPLLILWANAHGSVLIGAGLVALRGAVLAVEGVRAQPRQKDVLLRAAAFIVLPWLCTLASPYGLSLPGYYRHVLGNPEFSRVVSEWGPTTLRGQPFFFVLLLAGVWIMVRGRAATTPLARLAFLCSGAAGLLAVRYVVWFAFVAAATLPAAADAAWPRPAAARRPRLNLALAGGAVATAIGVSVWMATHDRSWFEKRYPARAASVVAAATEGHPGATVFADDFYADWLLASDPGLQGRIAFDSRFELLKPAQLEAIARFESERGLDWQRLARGYDILVLARKHDPGAIALFRREPGTTVLFRNPDLVVLRRGAAG